MSKKEVIHEKKDIKTLMAQDMANIKAGKVTQELPLIVKELVLEDKEIEPLSDVQDTKLLEDEAGNISNYIDPRLIQPEASYNPVGGDGVKACANCRWFNGLDGCNVVQGTISPTGVSDLWLAAKAETMPEIDTELEIEIELETETAAVETAIAAFMDKSGVTVEEIETNQKETVWQKIKAFFSTPNDTADLFNTETGFKVLSDNRFIAWYTNSYKDREGEIFTLKSIEEDTKRMFDSDDMPPLWFWHIKGTEHGQTEWIGTIGRFAVAIGTFHDTPMAKAFKKSYEKGSFSLSHGFLYDPVNLNNGVYTEYKTFEISVLPKEKAANQYTKFALSKGETKAMNLEQFEALEKTLGKKETVELMSAAQAQSKELDASGVEYKSKDTEPLETINPLELRVEAMESNLKQIAAFIKTANKASDPEEDDEDDEEEDTDDKKKKRTPDKKDNTPDGQKSKLADNMKEALLREMEVSSKQELQKRTMKELNSEDQIIVQSGLGQLIGLE